MIFFHFSRFVKTTKQEILALIQRIKSVNVFLNLTLIYQSDVKCISTFYYCFDSYIIKMMSEYNFYFKKIKKGYIIEEEK